MDFRRAPLTFLLIAMNILAFVYEVAHVGQDLLTGGGSLENMAAAGALVPVLVMARGDYWRIVTGGFLHGSVIHLAVNMYSLYVLGRFVEAIAGTRYMAAVYGISLVASGLAVVYFSDPYDVTVGASGAIFGLFGALFAIGLKLGPAGRPFVRANLGILALNLFITFTVPGISRWGHIGGLVAGFVVAYGIFNPARAGGAPRIGTSGSPS